VYYDHISLEIIFDLPFGFPINNIISLYFSKLCFGANKFQVELKYWETFLKFSSIDFSGQSRFIEMRDSKLIAGCDCSDFYSDHHFKSNLRILGHGLYVT